MGEVDKRNRLMPSSACMPEHSPSASRVLIIAVATTCLLVSVACAPHLESRPGVFEVAHYETKFQKASLHVTCAKPAGGKPSTAGMVVFFTGDAGWFGTSSLLFEHLAERGYYLVGYNSREVLKPVKQSGERLSIAQSADRMKEALAEARSKLGLEENTLWMVVGFSRGATAAAFTMVHPQLKDNLLGGVAVALTRESDYLRAPKPSERPPGIEVDDKERIQIYPALVAAATVPAAVIQSTGDKYVPSAESRRLLGPDTPRRRLYEVQAKNHSFSGGEQTLLRDLDDALGWLQESASAGGPSR